jgi:hypothetical protein
MVSAEYLHKLFLGKGCPDALSEAITFLFFICSQNHLAFGYLPFNFFIFLTDRLLLFKVADCNRAQLILGVEETLCLKNILL